MTVLFVIQILVVLMMIVVILMQKTTSDGLMTSGGSPDSFLSGRSSANVLSKTTAILATIFIANSLVMGYMASHSKRDGSIMDELVSDSSEPAKGAPASPADGVLNPGNVDTEGKTQPADTGSNEKPATDAAPAAKKPAEEKPASVPVAD